MPTSKAGIFGAFLPLSKFQAYSWGANAPRFDACVIDIQDKYVYGLERRMIIRSKL